MNKNERDLPSRRSLVEDGVLAYASLSSLVTLAVYTCLLLASGKAVGKGCVARFGIVLTCALNEASRQQVGSSWMGKGSFRSLHSKQKDGFLLHV